MIYISKKDIGAYDRINRLNLVNSITGYKPANLIGTTDSKGCENLAIFSSVVHLGSDPALIGLFTRPLKVERHTIENILETKFFTINHIHKNITQEAHYTSANFAKGVSEFEQCGLHSQFIGEFKAPYVKECKIKIGLSLVETIDIPLNGTVLIIGLIEEIYLEGNFIKQDGSLDLNLYQSVIVSGLDSYHSAEELACYPYARVDNLPDFN